LQKARGRKDRRNNINKIKKRIDKEGKKELKVRREGKVFPALN
jgi:hypothetical protein